MQVDPVYRTGPVSSRQGSRSVLKFEAQREGAARHCAGTEAVRSEVCADA